MVMSILLAVVSGGVASVIGGVVTVTCTPPASRALALEPATVLRSE